MLLVNESVCFKFENFFDFAPWMNASNICSRWGVNFCECSVEKSYVRKLFTPGWYRVNLRVSQTMLNQKQNWRVGVAHLHSAARALAFKSESVFSIINKSWQRFFSLSFVLRCYNNFHQRQNATKISVFLSHSETLNCENKLAKEFW